MYLIKKSIKIVIILLTFFLIVNKALFPLFISKQFILFIILTMLLLLITLIFSYKKVIIFLLLKQNKTFKKSYKYIMLKNKKIKKKIMGNVVFLLVKLVNFYKKYKYLVYMLIFFYAFSTYNYKLAFFIFINALFDFIYNHYYFKKFKKIIEQDLLTYNTHWLEDTDLRLITFLLRFLFLLGLFILIFSFIPPMFFSAHFLKLLPFTFDNCEFNLGTIQLILAVHLIGPKILIFVLLVKLLCDINIIYFRNTKTFYKMVALGGKVKFFFVCCGALYCTIEGVEKVISF